MSLKGGAELKARLKALRLAFKPVGRTWADEYVKLAQNRVPSRTGRLRRSIRRRNATQRRATVAAHFTAYFVDKGPKAHEIRPKKAKRLIFESGGRTIFAKRVRHRGYAGRPFRKRTAHDAIRKAPLAEQIVAQWNSAGGRAGFR